MSDITLSTTLLKPLLSKDPIGLEAALDSIRPGATIKGQLLYAIALAEDASLLAVLANRMEHFKDTSPHAIKALWTDNFKTFQWLWEQGPIWQRLLSNRLPVHELFTKNNLKDNRDWRQLASDVLDAREPNRLNTHPHLLQVMKNPSKNHIIAAACGRKGGYYKLPQLEEIRPGTSNWFEVRASLVGLENTETRSRALFEWLTYKDQPNLTNSDITLPDLTLNSEPELPG